MAESTINLDMNIDPRLPKRKDYGIGCIGSGFIMRDVHLVAYQGAGFRPVALASRTPDHARQAAALRGVPKVHDNWKQLLADPQVEILDIAFPPDQQLEIIREAERAGTFAISIKPHEDCCGFLMPRSPATRARAEDLRAAETPFDVAAEVAALVAGSETVDAGEVRRGGIATPGRGDPARGPSVDEGEGGN